MPVINSWECPIGDPSDVEELFTIVSCRLCERVCVKTYLYIYIYYLLYLCVGLLFRLYFVRLNPTTTT